MAVLYSKSGNKDAWTEVWLALERAAVTEKSRFRSREVFHHENAEC